MEFRKFAEKNPLAFLRQIGRDVHFKPLQEVRTNSILKRLSALHRSLDLQIRSIGVPALFNRDLELVAEIHQRAQSHGEDEVEEAPEFGEVVLHGRAG